MDLGLILKVTHALVGALFMAGLVGRWITLGAAGRADDLHEIKTLLALSSRFERLVIASSVVVLVLGIATAIVQGRPFLGPLQGAGIDWLFASLVIYLSALPLVPLVFLPRGRVFEAAFAESTAAGAVTPSLRAAFADRAVLAGHVYELAVTTVVFVLMVAKPF
jgi:hypothetical protein